MEKTLCSGTGDCVAIVLDTLGGIARDWWVSGIWDWWVSVACVVIMIGTLGGSARDWWVSGVWDWWVPAAGSQWPYWPQDLRKSRLRPSVCIGSMAVLPLGEVSVGDVASFWARV